MRVKERRREGEGEASPSNVCSLSTRQRGRMGRHESPVHEALSPPISQAPSHVGAGEVSRRAGSQPGTEEGNGAPPTACSLAAGADSSRSGGTPGRMTAEPRRDPRPALELEPLPPRATATVRISAPRPPIRKEAGRADLAGVGSQVGGGEPE